MMFKKWKNNGTSSFNMNRLQAMMKHQIQIKLQDGTYRLEAVPCCICSSTSFETLAEKDRFGLPLSVVICKTCGLIQTNPRMDQSAYNEFYNNEYRKILYGKESPSDWFFSVQYRRGRRIYEFLKDAKVLPSSSSPTTVLEIGCGAGGVLQFFREQGCSVRGVDLDKKYLAYGKERYGLDITEGTILDVVTETPPNIIIYSHVLEHILLPRNELKKISEIASQETIIYIEVPGVKNLIRTWDMNFLMFLQLPHVYHFSLTSLRNLLERNGFRFVKGNEVIRSVYKKNATPQPEHVIHNDYHKVKRCLIYTELLKQLFPAPPYRWKSIGLICISKALRIIGVHSIVRRTYLKWKP